jgi:hypothetical protein
MAKINLNGEWFDFDFDHKPMSEALALEKATGQRYADWETELGAGSMAAMCGLVWLIWRRDGREVPLEQIMDGTIEVDLGPLLASLEALAAKARAEDPTLSGTAPDRTLTTRTGTSPRSPRSTTSAPGKSAS